MTLRPNILLLISTSLKFCIFEFKILFLFFQILLLAGFILYAGAFSFLSLLKKSDQEEDDFLPVSWEDAIGKTRNYPLRGYILGVLTHITAWDRLWGGGKTLKCGFKIIYT